MTSIVTKLTSKYLIEVVLLIGLIIAVPLLEAPKNIFWLAYCITWLFNRFKDKNFGGQWDIWDSLIFTWIVSGYVISAFAGMHSSEWGGANDILRYGSILWLIKRSGYQRNELMWLGFTVITSTLIALTYAFWALYVSHTRQLLELNSVGHVNHSAIYMAISFGVALSYTLALWKKLGIIGRLLGTLCIVLFAVAVLISASRAAVAMAIVFAIILGIAWVKRSGKSGILLLVGIMCVVAGAYFAKIDVVKKQEAVAKENRLLTGRDQIWHSAIVAWKEFPLFGVGMHNYNQISMEKVQTWVEASGKPFDPSYYLGSAHGHSLFFTALAERGAIGLSVLVTILLSWLYTLIRFRPKIQDEDIEWALWGSSLSAWLVNVGVGFVNTTLHHEHGILSATLLGMWLAYLHLKKQNVSTTTTAK
ncbi:O-antigen ligase family protein [Sulfurirhabdus autotrophica]|uniref:O-antigen ligase n=1 Tax=Sulfurirhabdus autotrophica TaxID=1706046 RepID=A0A4R3XWZ9_9PROT|nr:O-antigen ligase family protein [Sulfurirhabdus autotrophica]TCV84285.1 O-antigen ligase [Sulfurirhabdus autotrophica]